MTRPIPLVEARARLPELVVLVQRGTTVEIVHEDSAVAVLISAADWRRAAEPVGDDWLGYAELCAKCNLQELDYV